MFCKNCGREIDQKTLKKLMENKGEPVVCSKCKQPLDNAEICGGFWGLIASAKEKEAEDLRAGGTTLMLDENGRPVQMGAPVQKRPAPAAAEADRERARTGFSNEAAPQNSGEYRGAERSASSYSRNESGIQPRRSGARKNNTELWITRVIAILLGICLIISLIRGCGHDEKRSAPDNTAGVAAPADENNEKDSSKDTKGKAVEKEEDNSDEDKDGNSEEGKTDNSNQDKTGTSDQEDENNKEQEQKTPAAGTGTTSEHGTGNDVVEMQKYDTITRTIIIDDRENNLESEVKFWNSKNIQTSYVKRNFIESGELITNQPGINNDTVVEKYSSGNRQQETTYTYKNGYLQKKKDNNNTITYKIEGSDTVIETSKNPRTVIKPDGTPIDYMKVKKTYRKKPDSEEIDNKLQTIEYYKTSKADVPEFTISYNIDNADPADEYINTFGSGNVFSYVESYSIDNSNETISIIGPDNDQNLNPDYEYDQIKYTYVNIKYGESKEIARLCGMEYLKDNKHVMGPNKFSYLICEYDPKDPKKRTDTFFDTGGNSVSITARDPFLSDTVISAFYSEEFPYLVGLPVKSSETDQTMSGSDINSGVNQTAIDSDTNTDSSTTFEGTPEPGPGPEEYDDGDDDE